ncbi:hypothetical protein [Sulfuricurvum sp.]|uniref:hypothetical protein n=1 Tax=Sulfuricurvum sp. TaxID=2025608 RepID=UPI0026053F77|nr:hypothetical protein [Sulfuricurvum sp.]MDD2781925.1 hypothetical protein [Sulfuricurvum sp.]
MAWYIDKSILQTSDGNKDWWKKTYSPADEVPVSGIYICTGCKREITSNKGDKFPPQNHHQHPTGNGSIKWKLIVRTNMDGQ